MKHGSAFLSLFILIGAVLLRGLLLEYSDLVDPTESRYASVAQEMVLFGDWATPRLPMPEGVIPYMGKPPLHFWLAASAYSLFGVDEWTARLPSWLAAIAILFVIWSFGKRYFGEEVGTAAALIAFSSGMLFFLAGASVTDVTLTALVTASTYSLYLFVESKASQKKLGLLASALMALAFLTKGPIAIVLVWLPLLLWSFLRKDFRWLKSIPWLSCSLVFLAITAPWFILNEIHNPGSLRYFFWNENIARYLFKEYGDKYGSGHVHPYGYSWLMLIAAFVPWSLVAAWTIRRSGWRTIVDRLKADQNFLCALVWGISAALFFTFVRQLHGMYVLPCIPGIALSCAVLFVGKELDSYTPLLEGIKCRRLQLIVPLISIVLIVAGAWLEFSTDSLIFGIGLAIGGILLLRKVNQAQTRIAVIQALSVSSFLIYLLVIVCLTPYIDERRSAGEILDDLADATLHQRKVPQVGIMTKNNFSLYWTSKAWENELSRELHVRFIEPGQIPKDVTHLILRSADMLNLPELEKGAFAFVRQRSEWKLFRRRNKRNV